MIQAAIFDLDGTVLDNEGIWEDVFQEVVNNHKLSIPNKQGKWLHEPGIGILNNWKKFVGNPHQSEVLADETKKLYIDATGDTEAVVMNGLVELVEKVKDQGWKTALATSSEWHTVEAQLGELDLYLAFDVTTTGEEVLESKPDPEIYLLTIQKLGIDPEECVVIEDSLAGVISAKSAGCIAVGLTSEYTTEAQLRNAGADLVVDSLIDVMIPLLEYGSKKDHKESDTQSN